MASMLAHFLVFAACLIQPASARQPERVVESRLLAIEPERSLDRWNLDRWIALSTEARQEALVGSLGAFGNPPEGDFGWRLQVSRVGSESLISVPVFERQVLRELGKLLNSAALERHADTLWTANTLANAVRGGVTREGELLRAQCQTAVQNEVLIDSRVIPAVMSASVTALNEMYAESGEFIRNDDSRAVLGAIIVQMVKDLTVVAQQAREQARLYVAEVADAHAAVKVRTVAIIGLDRNGHEQFLGTGVLFDDGLVATAAHVVATPELARRPTTHPMQVDYARLRVALPDMAKGSFSESPRLRVGDDSAVWPTLDAAVLSLRWEESEAVQTWRRNALATEMHTSHDCSDGGLEFVFGFSARHSENSPPVLTWMMHAPIVFPTQVLRPAVAEQIAGDHLFLAALLSQAGDVCPLQQTLDNIVVVAKELMDHYSECIEPARQVCRLSAPAGAAALVLFTTEPKFRRSPRIVCFAAALDSVSGCSGAPIYLARAKPVLAGIVSGRLHFPSSAMCNGSPKQYAQIVPWALVAEAWRNQQENFNGKVDGPAP